MAAPMIPVPSTAMRMTRCCHRAGRRRVAGGDRQWWARPARVRGRRLGVGPGGGHELHRAPGSLQDGAGRRPERAGRPADARPGQHDHAALRGRRHQRVRGAAAHDVDAELDARERVPQAGQALLHQRGLPRQPAGVVPSAGRRRRGTASRAARHAPRRAPHHDGRASANADRQQLVVGAGRRLEAHHDPAQLPDRGLLGRHHDDGARGLTGGTQRRGVGSQPLGQPGRGRADRPGAAASAARATRCSTHAPPSRLRATVTLGRLGEGHLTALLQALDRPRGGRALRGGPGRARREDVHQLEDDAACVCLAGRVPHRRAGPRTCRPCRPPRGRAAAARRGRTSSLGSHRAVGRLVQVALPLGVLHEASGPGWIHDSRPVSAHRTT